jgi:peptidoglycan/xylan/chitin deacetylase (PgdA/CDA1 family)
LRSIAINILRSIQFHKWLYQYVKLRNAITVLNLHRVNDDDDLSWPALTTENFKKLLEYITKQYSIIGLHEIETKTLKPKLILSFDDGYYDFIENALPVLQKMKLPCNMNIVTDCPEHGELIWTQRLNNILGFLYRNKRTFLIELPHETMNIDFTGKKLFYFKNEIRIKLSSYHISEIKKVLTRAENSIAGYNPGGNNKMMSWEDIIYCYNKGVHIGSHTQSHLPLQNIVDKETLYNELYLSKQIIENKLNTTIDTIAFPNGLYNDKVIEVSQQAGYKYLLLVGNKLFFNHHKKEPVLRIPRLLIHHNDDYSNLLVTSGITQFK